MRINLQNTPVLVLNASYEAINIISAKRAFTSVMKGIAAVEQPSNKVIHTGRLTLPVPSVIRLLEYRRIPHSARTLSKKGVLARDQHTCQYCMDPQPPTKLTLDHIIPSSRGGPSTWENLVAACFTCNNRKGDRTPTEAGMPLARYPKPFTIHTSRHLLREAGMAQESWQRYLFYDNVPVV